MSASSIGTGSQTALTFLTTSNEQAAAAANDTESAGAKLVDLAKQATGKDKKNSHTDTVSLSDRAKQLLEKNDPNDPDGVRSTALVNFNTSLSFGGYTIQASGDAGSGSNKLTLTDSSGGTFYDSVTNNPGGGGGEASGGFGGVPFSMVKQGNKTYLTFAGAEASTTDTSLSSGSTTLSQHTTQAAASAMTFVVDWSTGQITAESASASTSSTTTRFG